MPRKYRILLVNCIAQNQPNETVLLSEFFRMLKLRFPRSVDYYPGEVRSKNALFAALTANWPTIIHLSAHGDSGKRSSGRRGKNTGIKVGSSWVTAKDIAQMDGDIKAGTVFVSACLNSYKDMADAMRQKGADYYLAPKTEIFWVTAALFAVSFYKRLIWDKKDFDNAFRYAGNQTGSGKDFPEYWRR